MLEVIINFPLLVCSCIHINIFFLYTGVHGKLESSKMLYGCDFCGKVYKQKAGLYNHQKYDCGKDPQFQCPHCSYKTKHKGNLKCHVIARHCSLVV